METFWYSPPSNAPTLGLLQRGTTPDGRRCRPAARGRFGRAPRSPVSGRRSSARWRCAGARRHRRRPTCWSPRWHAHRRWIRHRRPQCRNGSRIGAAGRGGRISRRAVGPRCGERVPCGRGRGHHVAADAALDRRWDRRLSRQWRCSPHWLPSARSRRGQPRPPSAPCWVPQWRWPPSGCWRYPPHLDSAVRAGPRSAA